MKLQASWMKRVVTTALEEDIGLGDVTTEATVSPEMSGAGRLWAKEDLVLAGVEVAEQVFAEVDGGKARSITFENVPAFAVYLDTTIEVPHLGEVVVDVAFGGMFYVIADTQKLGLELRPDRAGELTRVGEMIKSAAREQLACQHPDNPGVSDITIGVLAKKHTRTNF